MLVTPEPRVDTGRYGKDSDCLAAWLLLEGAEVFAGAKPGNLINLKNRPRPCGRNLYEIWKREGQALLAASAVQGAVLADRGDSLLLYLHVPSAVERLLCQPAVARLLARRGYPEQAGRAEYLRILAERCRSADFPHEVGIFLGYPLKDVAGFMGLVNIGFTCQGPWRIYGNSSQSLALADHFRRCRSAMAVCLSRTSENLHQLMQGGQPFCVPL